MNKVDKFIYKKAAGITALAASITDFKYKRHAHQEYAIGVTLRGIQHYYLDGSVQLSHRNGVMFFNPEQVHDGMAHNEEGLDYVMLYIDPQLLLEAADKKEIIRFTTPILYDDKLALSVVKLAHAILGGKDESLCSELFLSLTDFIMRTDFDSRDEKDHTLVRRAKDMLHANLEHVLNLDEICNELGLSKFQFIRLFKTHTGITPYQYFLSCKIERARQLIEANKDVYAAVAQCGFVDITHLNKHFKRVYGTTAHEYLSHIS